MIPSEDTMEMENASHGSTTGEVNGKFDKVDENGGANPNTPDNDELPTAMKDNDVEHSNASVASKEVTFTTTTEDSNKPSGVTKRLEFPQKKLYGRAQELDQIQFAYQKILQPPHHHAQALFISGYSGCGKTALAEEAARRIGEQHKHEKTSAPFVIRGRYEPQRTSLPYKGIAEAFAHWFKNLSSRDKRKLSQVHVTLKQAIGDDVNSLANIVPSLRKLILGKEDVAKESNQPGVPDSDQKEVMSKSQLQFAFISLLRCICQSSAEKSIIMYIDDLQNADFDSLELIESLISYQGSNEPPVPKFLFLGSFRANEVPPEHPLAIMVEKLEVHDERPEESTVETLTLADLSKDSVQEFIADTLDQRSKGRRISTLTNAVYERTLGNMFYTKQALDTLFRENILLYDTATCRWNWVLETEEELKKLLPTDMVYSKIMTTPKELRRALTVASYTRSTFDVNTLCVLMNVTDPSAGIQTDETLLPLLELAVADGLLVHAGDDFSQSAASSHDSSNRGSSRSSGRRIRSDGSISLSTREGEPSSSSTASFSLKEFSFAHDRIRETASGLISDQQELDKFRLLIGNALVECAQDDGEAWMFFVGVHHLNLVPKHFFTNDEKKLRMASLNFESADESLTKAAFETAAKFAEKGIAYLPESCWEGPHRDLAYSLHAVAAEAQRLLGNIESMEKYCQNCLGKQQKRPMDEMFGIYYTLAVGLMYGSDRYQEVREIILNLLEAMDFPFPRSPTAAKKAFLAEMISFMWNKSKWHDSLRNADFMTDTKKIKAMQAVRKLGALAYLLGDKATVALTVLRGTMITIKHGVCVHSPTFVAGVGAVTTGLLNDLTLSRSFGDDALFLLDKVNMKASTPPTVWMTYFLGKAWTLPPSACIEPLRKAFHVGLSTDQSDHTSWSAIISSYYCFASGKPLDRLDDDLNKECKRSKSAGLRVQNVVCTVFRRMVLGLTSKDKDVLPVPVLTQAEESTSYLPVFFQNFERSERGYLGEYKLCADHAAKHKDFGLKRMRGSFLNCVDAVISGLSCLIMHGITRKTEYKREFKRLYGLLSNWAKVKEASPVIRYGKLLLDAESSSIKGRITSAETNFEQAMELALKYKHVHDASLIAERWAVFALNCLQDEAQAKERLDQALLYSKKWGAVARTENLETRFASLLE